MNEIKLDTREMDRIIKQSGLKARQVVKRLAFKVEAGAKMRAALKTGALRNSIYTIADRHDGYSQASSAAKGANGKVITGPIPTPSDKDVAHVGPAVNYGAYVEFGTHRMAAQPYLTPAVEAMAQEFNDGKTWEEVVK